MDAKRMVQASTRLRRRQLTRRALHAWRLAMRHADDRRTGECGGDGSHAVLLLVVPPRQSLHRCRPRLEASAGGQLMRIEPLLLLCGGVQGDGPRLAWPLQWARHPRVASGTGRALCGAWRSSARCPSAWMAASPAPAGPGQARVGPGQPLPRRLRTDRRCRTGATEGAARGAATARSVWAPGTSCPQREGEGAGVRAMRFGGVGQRGRGRGRGAFLCGVCWPTRKRS